MLDLKVQDVIIYVLDFNNGLILLWVSFSMTDSYTDLTLPITTTSDTTKKSFFLGDVRGGIQTSDSVGLTFSFCDDKSLCTATRVRIICNKTNSAGVRLFGYSI